MILRALAFAIIAAAIGSASAGSLSDPPHHYRSGKPTVPVTIHIVPGSKVQTICRLAALDGRRVDACAHLTWTACTIYIADYVQSPVREFRRLVDHEMAHCRGWGHD